MKLAILSMIATTLAAQGFNIITIRSGSQYQYQGLILNNDNVVVGSKGDTVDFVLNDDGTLGDTASKKWLTVKDSNFVLSDKSQDGFAINNGQLVYQSKANFGVCPSDNHIEYGGSCEGGLGLVLKVVGQKTVDTFTTGSSDTSTTTSKSTSKPTSTCTDDNNSGSGPTEAPSDVVPGKKFTLVAIHSGSQFQYTPIKKVDSHPHVFSVGGDEGSNLEVSFQDDKTSLVDSSGRGINLDSQTGELGNVAPFGRAPATPGFSIVDGDLAYNGGQGWSACPSGENKYSLALSECTGGTGIALKVIYI
ncbi:CIC11C00000003305 [Sungouiella intermedia]|uniref:CIC11C00000003305 n=1 Tax=Sungouiella intermedia TaxID=45354 RepID=A0A1L0G0C9_9ASCO|nr:CIC11C00000003305 [[Candida] intermedia]